MPTKQVNGIEIYYETRGRGEAIGAVDSRRRIVIDSKSQTYDLLGR